MNFLKNKLTAPILVVVLIGLLGGCGNDKTKIIEGENKKGGITVSVGDTIYIEYGWSTAMFLVDKVDTKNRVFIGRQCNNYDLLIRTKRVLSFADYEKNKVE